MINQKMKIIRNALEKERAALLIEIQNETKNLPIYTEINPDPLDLADISFQQEISLVRLRYIKQRLWQVDAALKRLDDGTYGMCDECGQPINPDRLEAMPYATSCVNCKKGQERVG
ncbi:MAG TPA: TraR/DksA C4-type zinc finger protein [Anaerolineales bacterium]|nr:TraR/DksA C4-type zinc finger protein [Anaerolineales bacterium]